MPNVIEDDDVVERVTDVDQDRRDAEKKVNFELTRGSKIKEMKMDETPTSLEQYQEIQGHLLIRVRLQDILSHTTLHSLRK